MLSLSDFATLAMLTTLNELEIKHSEALPLIGFDDFGFASLVNPPLTVIRQPIEKMVRYAMNVLFHRIDGDVEGIGQQIMLPGDLVSPIVWLSVSEFVECRIVGGLLFDIGDRA